MQQSQLNGHQKKVINQYINDTLSKYQIFQKQKYQQGKFYEQTIAGLKGELGREKQRIELLEEELREMKERYGYLKRQEDIMGMLRGGEKNQMNSIPQDNYNHIPNEKPSSLPQQPDTSLPLRFTDMSSIIDLDESRLKQFYQLQKFKLTQLLSESQSHSQRLKQQNDQYQKQVHILTEYINEKEMKYEQKIQELQKEVEGLEKVNQKIVASLGEKKDTQYVKTLENKIKVLEQNVHKCTMVVKQSQQYYTSQISQLNSQLTSLTQYKSLYDTLCQQFTSMQQSFKTILKNKAQVDKLNASLQQQLQKIKRGIDEDLEEIERRREQERGQFEFGQRLLVETFEKKIEIMEQEWTEREREYRDKIGFLIIKLEQEEYERGNHEKKGWKGASNVSNGKYSGGSVGNLNSLASIHSLSSLSSHKSITPLPFPYPPNPPSSHSHSKYPLNLQQLSVCESQSVSYREEPSSFRFDSASISRAIKENMCMGMGRVSQKKEKDVPAQKDKERDITPVKRQKRALMQRMNLNI